MLRNTKLAAIVIAASFVLSGSQTDAQVYGFGKDKKPQHTVKFSRKKTAGKTGFTISNPRLNPVNKTGKDLRGYPDGLGQYGIQHSNRFGTNIRHLFGGNGALVANPVQPVVAREFDTRVPTPAHRLAPRPEPKRIGNTYVAPASNSSFANVSSETEIDEEVHQPIKNPFFSVLKIND